MRRKHTGSPLRVLGGVVAGLITGVIVIAGAEAVGSRVYPLPSGFDPADPEAFRAYVAQLPVGAFLFVLAGWGLGSFLGSWLATRLGPRRHFAPGLIVGAVLFVAGVANMLLVSHPSWFWVAALVTFATFTYGGTRLGATPL